MAEANEASEVKDALDAPGAVGDELYGASPSPH